jgi:hypothetical protein
LTSHAGLDPRRVQGYRKSSSLVCAESYRLRARAINTYAGLLDYCRQRKDELGLSYEALDHLAGLAHGHSDKILRPVPIKGFGPISMNCIFGALALTITISVDRELAKRMRPRWEARQFTGKVSRPRSMPRNRAVVAQDSNSARLLI